MALGRGLGELLGEVETAYENSGKNAEELQETKIKISKVITNPNQPRKIFDEDKLSELADSIKNHGLIQPIAVKKNEDDTYTLISGERRLRAHKLLNKDDIEAIVLDVEDLKLRELALIENIQRDDLNVIELAYSYAQLINEHTITHEELATRISKSRSSITNTLRLLQLSPYVQQLLANNKISAGHAKIMLNLSEQEQKIVADTIIGQKLSVRETENLVKNLKNETKPKKLKETLKKEFNYEPLNGFMNNLKDNNLKAKFDKNTLKIELKSQADIERLSALLNIEL